MLIVKNWGRFQHFKDRDPVWIKLYRSILTDPDVMSLTPRAFRTLVLLWLIAARGNGALPDLDSIRFHLRDADIDGGDLALLVEKGFLEEADTPPGARRAGPISGRGIPSTEGYPREEGEEEKRETFGSEPEPEADQGPEMSSAEDDPIGGPGMRSDAPVAARGTDPPPTPSGARGAAGRGRGARNPGHPGGRRPVVELAGPDSPPDDPVLAEFPCVGGKSVPVRFGWVGQFRGTYPGIDLAQETLKASAWAVSNPAKRKTPGGLARFLTGWYSRAQDDVRGSSRGGARSL